MKKLIRYGPLAIALAALMISLGAFAVIDKRHVLAVTWCYRAMIAVVLIFPAARWAERGER